MTSRGMSWDKPGRDIPLSRDKIFFLSRCPGTRAGANVPGQIPLSRPVPGQNNLKFFKVKHQIYCFRTSFSCFRTSFSVLEHPFSVLERIFLLCPVLSRILSRFLAVPARPRFWLSRPVPSLGKIFNLSRCPFVPGQWWNFCPVVPKVSLSHPVGNTSPNQLEDQSIRPDGFQTYSW